jgi:hypothetical protein
MSEYDFEIKHIKVKENKVVDGLNIRAHEVHILAINMFNIDLKDNFRGCKFRPTICKNKRNLGSC